MACHKVRGVYEGWTHDDKTLLRPYRGISAPAQLLSDRAVFTEAYAVIPKGVFGDIVTSNMPFWEKTRLWVLARPLPGFAETFSQYIMEVALGAAATDPSSTLGRTPSRSLR